MHEWGDKWFQQHGYDLYHAINEIETGLRKYGIGVYGKEKWGMYRDDFLRFWDGSLYIILFGYRARIGTFHYKGLYRYKWFTNFINRIHSFIYNKIDHATPNIPDGTPFGDYDKYYDKRIWKGLIYYNEKIGLTKLVQDWQADKYNKVFQTVCKKYPYIIDELIADTCGYKMIKPGKYGNIDGTKIHNKYWKPVN